MAYPRVGGNKGARRASTVGSGQGVPRSNPVTANPGAPSSGSNFGILASRLIGGADCNYAFFLWPTREDATTVELPRGPGQQGGVVGCATLAVPWGDRQVTPEYCQQVRLDKRRFNAKCTGDSRCCRRIGECMMQAVPGFPLRMRMPCIFCNNHRVTVRSR